MDYVKGWLPQSWLTDFAFNLFHSTGFVSFSKKDSVNISLKLSDVGKVSPNKLLRKQQYYGDVLLLLLSMFFHSLVFVFEKHLEMRYYLQSWLLSTHLCFSSLHQVVKLTAVEHELFECNMSARDSPISR